MQEKGTDWRQFRKSTHLASADLDAMESEGRKLIFNIREVKHEKNVDVSGKKVDGVFCYFKEPIKALKLNSGNMNILASFSANNGAVGAAKHLVENWGNLVIELYVDRNVKFGRDIVDGIRIRPVQPKINKVKPEFTPDKFEAAHKAKATIETILKNYTITEENKQAYGVYQAAN